MTTIVWDVDDVLNDLMGAWLEQEWLPNHPGCQVRYQDLRSNPPHALLGVPLNEYLDSLDTFRRCRYPELAPVPETLAWFERHGESYRHMALSAVPLEYAPISAAWVMRHFGKWIRSFNFVPSPRQGEFLPGYDLTKQEFLSWWGKPAVLVDDRAENVAAARAAGAQAVVARRPWNDAAGGFAETFQELQNL